MVEDWHRDLLSRCVSIDLEVDPGTAGIFAFAAVRHDERPALNSRSGLLERHLDLLEVAIQDVRHPIGHNFLQHDMEHLIAARPRLLQIMQAPIDTLWLNPLAFPRNPYHHLVKHYQDGRLAAGHVNDPELDARLVFEVLANQLDSFRDLARSEPDAVLSYHYLTTRLERSAGFDAVFRYVRNADCPSQEETLDAICRMLERRACGKRVEQTMERLASPQNGWPMAYALSWITVASGDSVMPPWVRAQFREASLIVRHLRDTSCKDPNCEWCAEQNDPVRALNKWFGFESFRPQPVDSDGRPLQERIVDEAMSGNSLLGILPTGTGKSLCYQIPALSRFDKTGALTVVISPLVALMADQVQGMERSGISCAVTINGMMSMPESLNLKFYVALQCLASLRVTRRMLAMCAQAVELSTVFSQSLANRRHLPNHAKVRSTTQRMGSRTKPFTAPGRLTISRVHLLPMVCRSLSPAYPPSAKIWRSQGNFLPTALSTSGAPSRSWMLAA